LLLLYREKKRKREILRNSGKQKWKNEIFQIFIGNFAGAKGVLKENLVEMHDCVTLSFMVK
jgi:hypothetical protein